MPCSKNAFGCFRKRAFKFYQHTNQIKQYTKLFGNAFFGRMMPSARYNQKRLSLASFQKSQSTSFKKVGLFLEFMENGQGPYIAVFLNQITLDYVMVYVHPDSCIEEKEIPPSIPQSGYGTGTLGHLLLKEMTRCRVNELRLDVNPNHLGIFGCWVVLLDAYEAQNILEEVKYAQSRGNNERYWGNPYVFWPQKNSDSKKGLVIRDMFVT
ncbi:MAG TPA: hypothetical protein DCL42_02835 [Deltaproteobacteria bacterium]|nr:hypothetical protein [Deltaproteobacteria bacterium]